MARCTYTVGDKNASGDYYAPFLNDDQRIYFWNAYGFHGNADYWKNGWGWDDDANTDKALARTFNACWVLTYSAIDYPNDSYSTPNILNWGRRYVRDKMETCRAHCGSNLYAIATTFTGAFVDDLPSVPELLRQQRRRTDRGAGARVAPLRRGPRRQLPALVRAGERRAGPAGGLVLEL
jgi:hypothetical protein